MWQGGRRLVLAIHIIRPWSPSRGAYLLMFVDKWVGGRKDMVIMGGHGPCILVVS